MVFEGEARTLKIKKATLWLVAALVGVLPILSSRLWAGDLTHAKTTKHSHRRGVQSRKVAAISSPRGASKSRTTARSRRSARLSSVSHRSRHNKKTHVPAWRTVSLQGTRVVEIQQALAQTGYLKSEPTGRWDESTREAMRRYQSANGFAATGLPEAKTLMKLGLGPHALPSELDPTIAAQVRSDASVESSRSLPDGDRSLSSSQNQ